MSSEVRPGRTADAADVGALLDLPQPAASRLIRTRTVQVAVLDGAVTGCLAYDVHEGVVSVTRIGGDPKTFEGLLEGPRRLATAEGCPVEVFVGADEQPIGTALEDIGFTAAGEGPRFADESTTRYRWVPRTD